MSVPFIADAEGRLVQQLENVQAAPLGQERHVWLRELLHRHPTLLPLESCGIAFTPPASVGCGINTGRGELDNLCVSPHGRITLVMIDAPWRTGLNQPVEALLEHGRCISRWSSAELWERAAQSDGDAEASLRFAARMAEAQQRAGVSAAYFEAALAASLREGDFLMVVAGEQVSPEACARVEELRSSWGMGLRLAIVELPFYRSRDEHASWQITIPKIVVPASQRMALQQSPYEQVTLVLFLERKSCRAFHDRLQAAEIPWRTRVTRTSAEVFVARMHERRARQLLQEHQAEHPDSPELGFEITYDYAIFGSLIAGAFGMILMAVEFRQPSDAIRPLLLMLLGGIVGWVIQQGRNNHRATGSYQFCPGGCLIACGAALLAAIVFLGSLR